MAYTTIDDPEAYFQVKAYTGNAEDESGTTQAITLDGDTDMSPNLVWLKERAGTADNRVFDSVRGVEKVLRTNTTGVEGADDALTAFGSDGFTLDDSQNANENGMAMVAWCWKESATAGFDIVSYTGNGSTRTISHSLSAVPHFFITKCRSTDGLSWKVYHHKNTSAPETDSLTLQSTGATDDDANYYNDTAPTSSVFSLGASNDLNDDGETFIGYLWSEKQGFSKFGSYIGSGSASSGPFVYTGFKPAWILFKSSSTASRYWEIHDNKRDPFNPSKLRLWSNVSTAEATENYVDFLSNGFKFYTNDVTGNESGSTYIYIAFAEAPFVNSNGVPCNAR